MSAAPPRRIERISGTALPLRGNDIDTDRIIPARFLRSVTFEGLEEHLFEDDVKAAGGYHPFSDPRFRSAALLLVNRNFGCGSSREHAPQALQRRGIRAVIGESYSEIFFGNSAAIGLPCVTASSETVERLIRLVEEDAGIVVSLRLVDLTVSAGEVTLPVSLPPAARDAFVEGLWDATGLLLDRYAEVRSVAERLPYLQRFERLP